MKLLVLAHCGALLRQAAVVSGYVPWQMQERGSTLLESIRNSNESATSRSISSLIAGNGSVTSTSMRKESLEYIREITVNEVINWDSNHRNRHQGVLHDDLSSLQILKKSSAVGPFHPAGRGDHRRLLDDFTFACQDPVDLLYPGKDAAQCDECNRDDHSLACLIDEPDCSFEEGYCVLLGQLWNFDNVTGAFQSLFTCPVCVPVGDKSATEPIDSVVGEPPAAPANNCANFTQFCIGVLFHEEDPPDDLDPQGEIEVGDPGACLILSSEDDHHQICDSCRLCQVPDHSHEIGVVVACPGIFETPPGVCLVGGVAHNPIKGATTMGATTMGATSSGATSAMLVLALFSPLVATVSMFLESLI